MEKTRHDAVVIVSGFDPGGGEKFGCAVLNTATRRFKACNKSSVDEAFKWLKENCEEPHNACGIDAMLQWQSGPSGWRSVDEWLKEKYKHASKSVFSSNSAYGAMAVQGAILASKIRTEWPKLLLTETHPKILYFHHTKQLYPSARKEDPMIRAEKFEAFLDKLELVGKIENDDQFDAVISAWAAMKALNGDWKQNLFVEVKNTESFPNFEFVKDARYFWPEHHVH